VASDDSSDIGVVINSGNGSFPPFIQGTTQYAVKAGVVQVNDVAFAATPGSNYSLAFTSNAINAQRIAAADSGGVFNLSSSNTSISTVTVVPISNLSLSTTT